VKRVETADLTHGRVGRVIGGFARGRPADRLPGPITLRALAAPVAEVLLHAERARGLAVAD
jgi:hypothetical protein